MGASHQPIFMIDCLTICHMYLPCLPSEWVRFCVPGAIEERADAEWFYNKIRLSAFAPSIGFQQKVHNIRIDKPIPSLRLHETITNCCIETLLCQPLHHHCAFFIEKPKRLDT